MTVRSFGCCPTVRPSPVRDKLGVSLAHLEVEMHEFLRRRRGWSRLFYREMTDEEAPCRNNGRSGRATRCTGLCRVRQGYAGDRTGSTRNRLSGCERPLYGALDASNDRKNSAAACGSAISPIPLGTLRDWEQNFTEEEADEKMSRRFMSLNLAKPMEKTELISDHPRRVAYLRRPAIHHQLADLRRPGQRCNAILQAAPTTSGMVSPSSRMKFRC